MKKQPLRINPEIYHNNYTKNLKKDAKTNASRVLRHFYSSTLENIA